ncbi:MAG: phosphopantothenoylcysteine decarboxylase [Elusimicrobia bacterium]|jgi:phosphopantothenoylcysteine decarboxylase/phosphopantothenate--cysteine ligase|nr:phosphopantothenoylcysteine decarboxylase [Elusimicrobiota bacterium]
MLSWENRKLVITAGPTREALDPVRFLSNESSGRMGWALAEAAQKAGAQVTLVAGPTNLDFPKNIKVIPVVTAREMLTATRRAARGAHAVVGAAAVADWRPITVSRTKLKKNGRPMVLRLTPNPDILGTLAAERRGPFPRLAGFALETQKVLAHAKKKMSAKNLDIIVANSPASLGSSRTQAWILRPGTRPERFGGSKIDLARRLLAKLLTSVQNHGR